MYEYTMWSQTLAKCAKVNVHGICLQHMILDRQQQLVHKKELRLLYLKKRSISNELCNKHLGMSKDFDECLL